MIKYQAADEAIGLASVAEAAGIPLREVLHGHTSMDTAYLQPDYPYGRQLRCQRRVWLEQAAKGAAKGRYRLVAQTTNPKQGDRWNKPHASVYQDWAVMVREPENGEHYVSWSGFGYWGPSPAEDVKYHVNGIYGQLTQEQRAAYDMRVQLNHAGNSEGWHRWDERIVPEFLAYHAEHGVWPTERAHVGTYVPEYEFPAAIAAALLIDYRMEV